MWSTIIGHKRQIEQLKRTLASGKFSSAYLFHGPQGVGKRRVAEALAMALACNNSCKSEWNACGDCTGCRKAASKNHPDIFTIEPEESAAAAFQSIKIETMRKLQSDLQYHPLEAMAKLAIIDDADRMMEAAANSLLKILEEPPAHTHFVLITPLPHRLLPTIRSRCQHIAFQPLTEAEIASALSAYGGLSDDEAARIARLSGGSLGRALTLETEFVDAILGHVLTLSRRPSNADILQTAEEWKSMDAAKGPLIFDLLTSWYRDIILYKSTGNPSPLIHKEATQAADMTTQSMALKCLEEITSARFAASTTANKQLIFEHLLFTLTGVRLA